ncbi:4-hydroxy-tetrahydrodipicolinate reductase [Pseudoalteromonas sp.]|uniref:4-hydroxy-tetrahydrodipicolinate reductase n=1 Tax=Pseudoalteromonas sp. TaxID=53249 RepID=UPI003567193C
MTNIAIFGANGRMGKVLCEASLTSPNTTLAAAYVRDAHELIGSPVQACITQGQTEVTFSAESEIGKDIDVAIDFTLKQGMRKHLQTAIATKTPLVIGTTGLEASDMQALQQAAQQIPIVFARNYSVGVNLLLNLVQTAATKMGDDLDIEIFEAHHRHKIDAPSGTALAIGEAIADAKGWDHDTVAVYDRSQVEQAKTQHEIGYSVLRGGDIVGEHTAYFATMGERLELTHKASSRMTFALGAIRAAAWLKNKPAGLYDMQDVLDLK